MRDIIFAWLFTAVLWCVLPYAQITRLETIIAVSYFFIVGLYIYAVIERKVKRNRARKRAYKNRKIKQEKKIA